MKHLVIIIGLLAIAYVANHETKSGAPPSSAWSFK